MTDLIFIIGSLASLGFILIFIAFKWNSEAKKLEAIYDLTPVYDKMVKERSDNKQNLLLGQEESTIKITIGKAFKDPNTGLNIVLCPTCFNKMSLFLWQGTKRCLSCGQGIGKIEELEIDYTKPQVGTLVEDEILHAQYVVCPICNNKNTLTSIETNKTCSVCSVIIGSILNSTTGELSTLDVSEILTEYENKFMLEEEEVEDPLIQVNNEEKIVQITKIDGLIGLWNDQWQVRCLYCGNLNPLTATAEIETIKCSRCFQSISSFKLDDHSPLVDASLTPLVCPQCGTANETNDALVNLIEQQLKCECGFSFIEYMRDPQKEEEFYQMLLVSRKKQLSKDETSTDDGTSLVGTRMCPNCFTIYSIETFECETCDVYLDPQMAKENDLDPFAKNWAFNYDLRTLQRLIKAPLYVGKQVYCPTCDSYHETSNLLAQNLQKCPLDGNLLTNNKGFCEQCSIQYPVNYNFCMQCGDDIKLLEFEAIIPMVEEEVKLPTPEVPTISIFCHTCRQEHEYDYVPRFCKTCASEISEDAKTCSRCNVFYPPFYKFCQECGSKLAPTTLSLPTPSLEPTSLPEIPTISIFCHTCRQEHEYDYVPRFCKTCASEISEDATTCSRCNIFYPPFYKFCQECGSKLAPTTLSLPTPTPKLSEIPIHCATCNAIHFYDHPVKFCKKCGSKVTLQPLPRCPKCQTFNPPGSKFCKKCGSKTYTWTPSEQEVEKSLLESFQQLEQAPSPLYSATPTTDSHAALPTDAPEHVVDSAPASPTISSTTTPVTTSSNPQPTSSSLGQTQQQVSKISKELPKSEPVSKKLSIEIVKTRVVEHLRKKKYKLLDPSEFGYKIDILARKRKQLLGIQISDNPTTAMMDELLFTGFPGKWLILVLSNEENQQLGKNQQLVTSLNELQKVLDSLIT